MGEDSSLKISVVVPFFNEEKCAGEVCREILRVLGPIFGDGRISAQPGWQSRLQVCDACGCHYRNHFGRVVSVGRHMHSAMCRIYLERRSVVRRLTSQ